MPKIGKGKLTAKVDKLYLRWFAYGMILLLVSVLQSSPRVFPVIGGAHPFPLLPTAVCIAMFEGPLVGAGVGVGAGVLWAMYADRLFGFDALLLLVIGCLCGLLVQVFIRNNWMSALLLNGAVLVIYTLVDWLVRYVLFSIDGALWALWDILLPNMLYTFALSPVLYFLIYRVARALRESE